MFTKLPLINDCLACDTTCGVLRNFRDVRNMFTSGSSLKDILVKSSFCKPMCPQERQGKAEKKGGRHNYKCQAGDAGFSDVNAS